MEVLGYWSLQAVTKVKPFYSNNVTIIMSFSKMIHVLNSAKSAEADKVGPIEVIWPG